MIWFLQVFQIARFQVTLSLVFQNESSRKSFHMKICLHENPFVHIHGFAQRLLLTQRQKVIRKKLFITWIIKGLHSRSLAGAVFCHPSDFFLVQVHGLSPHWPFPLSPGSLWKYSIASHPLTQIKARYRGSRSVLDVLLSLSLHYWLLPFPGKKTWWLFFFYFTTEMFSLTFIVMLRQILSRILIASQTFSSSVALTACVLIEWETTIKENTNWIQKMFYK